MQDCTFFLTEEVQQIKKSIIPCNVKGKFFEIPKIPRSLVCLQGLVSTNAYTWKSH